MSSGFTSTLASATATPAASSMPSSGASATGPNQGYPANGEAFSNLPTSASFGNTVYPGYVSFVTPTRSDSVYPLYPITANSNVTFRWQYTYLRVRPISLTLDAVGPNSVTYTVSAMDGNATEVIWNLGSVPTQPAPLMNGYYRLQLYDQRGISASYSPGWMMPCTTMSIALYTPDFYDPYTTMSGYCPLCFYNAGQSFHESLTPIVITLSIAVLSSVILLVNILH
ncbi:MAG: hypothetical protein EXX96DRAFT_573903 [Benjaminiella poitrasii]|nr:MAG: hypothetical protein EXX96DRAFT_573903 [Benjaminiella poitrasii]